MGMGLPTPYAPSKEDTTADLPPDPIWNTHDWLPKERVGQHPSPRKR